MNMNQPNQLICWRKSWNWTVGSWHLGSPSCSSAELGRHNWSARNSRSCPRAGVSALRDQKRERRGQESVLLRYKSNLLVNMWYGAKGKGPWARDSWASQQGSSHGDSIRGLGGQNGATFPVISLPCWTWQVHEHVMVSEPLDSLNHQKRNVAFLEMKKKFSYRRRGRLEPFDFKSKDLT